MKQLSIVTWLWSGATMGPGRVQYVADHVNRLYSMVQRNLTLPHRFICVTDQPEGIRPEVEIVPMWPDLCQYGRCYRRLKVFDPAMREVLGPRIVSIDLDTVIVGNIDHLFDRPEPFVIWGDRAQVAAAAGTPYCGSLFMLDIGYRPDVFTAFDPKIALDLRKTRGWVGSDQAWIGHMIPGAPVWKKADGIYSFRLDIQMHVPIRQRGFIAGRRQYAPRPVFRNGELPEKARIVFFHGAEDPSQTHLHVHHKWIEAHWK
jgi:hypothetical protein